MIEVIKKDIPSFEGLYYATTDGRVFSYDSKVWFAPQNKFITRKGKERKQKLTNGYLYVGLHKNKKIKNIFVHRILAMCFIPNPANKPQVNHINGIKTDNRLENLEWCTAKENHEHAIKTGLKRLQQGEIQHNSIFNSKDIKDIFFLLKKGTKQRDIAKMYNVHYSTISDIKRRKSWKHIK